MSVSVDLSLLKIWCNN